VTRKISITITSPEGVNARQVFETMVGDFYDMNKGSYTEDELEQIRFDVEDVEGV